MANDTKTYPVPWRGQVILACRKCQKKLKGHHELRALAKLKKTVKQHNKAHPAKALHVLNVPCMDLCPKGGVTVCNPARFPNGLVILRSAVDIGRLCGAA
jgi:predicted metal-binding protein